MTSIDPGTRPVLYSGIDSSLADFRDRTGLLRTEVRRVTSLRQLRGYKDVIWFIDHGYEWLLKDQEAMYYARTHNIAVYRVNVQTLWLFREYVNREEAL